MKRKLFLIFAICTGLLMSCKFDMAVGNTSQKKISQQVAIEKAKQILLTKKTAQDYGVDEVMEDKESNEWVVYFSPTSQYKRPGSHITVRVNWETGDATLYYGE